MNTSTEFIQNLKVGDSVIFVIVVALAPHAAIL